MRRPVILDCTIRDGSYAIDFKFTARDTALIAGQLDRAGVEWIEVGHGLGLGAAAAGKGRSTDDDIKAIADSVAAVERAQIGVFFIPGIGSDDDMRAAADAGLHFVRVGHNADEMEGAWPSVRLARSLGLVPFVNLMKTYGISVDEYAEVAVRAEAEGARGVYVVDSAGGMVPDEVARYVEAARERTSIDQGFHGHSNLHLAVANALAAYDAGATFIDTSVFGIGRSSGNVPTEVAAAVFDRLGIDTGIDPLEIIEIAETYLRPVAEHLHPHDMIAVSLGLGRFHSSYLERAMRAAEESGVSPFRLIVELGRQDQMRLPQELLDATVEKLRDKPAPQVRPDLARFDDPRFGALRIGNRPGATSELVDALEVVAAKRHLDIVLDLVPAPALDEEAVTAEFVLEDHFMALGRLRYGSLDALADALGGVAERVDLALADTAALPADQRPATLACVAEALPERVVPYASSALALELLGDVALAAVASSGATAVRLLDPGEFAAGEVGVLEARLRAAAAVVRDGDADLVVVAGAAPRTGEALPEGAIALRRPGDEPPATGVALARDDAYRDRLPRWKQSLALTRPAADRLLH